MNTAVLSADAYFGSVPTERQQPLTTIRDLIKHIWPRIVEDMAHGMPTYHLDGHMLCALANQKHFMALYIIPYDLLNAFKNDLKVHDCGKSCVRFKRLNADTLDLFDRILKYTGHQMSTSRFYGRAERAPVAMK